MVRLKHTVIREVMIQCEIKSSDDCYTAESYTPMIDETIEVSLKSAKKHGWCIVKGKTCCPVCKEHINNNVSQDD